MRFNDIVTVYRKSGNTYAKHTLSGVYMYGNAGTRTQGNGQEQSSSWTLFVPNPDADVLLNDYVMNGNGPDITSVNQLSGDVFKVSKITISKVGSPLDNLVADGN